MAKKKKTPKGFRSVKGEVVDASERQPKAPLTPPESELDSELALGLPPRQASETTNAILPADPVARYLAEIRRYPLLTREQEHDLAVKYREAGDPKAAEALVTANLRFVVKVAAEYTRF